MSTNFVDNTAYIDIDCGIDMAATFQCGQAFRWKEVSPDVFEGVAGKHRALVEKTVFGLTITPCDEALYEGFWRHYLDIDRDYCACAETLSRDEVLAPMVQRCRGMRLLNQPVWECLISFILSSNNNVKRISGIIERLCTRYGEDMGGYYAFPAADVLAEAGERELKECGTGYRAAYIAKTAQAVAAGFNIDILPYIGYEAAKEELLKLHGVGEKVADCVLLFSCGYGEAFPVDVWVHRAVISYFFDADRPLKGMREFARKRFGPMAGLAQQYLFHYERICKKDSSL